MYHGPKRFGRFPLSFPAVRPGKPPSLNGKWEAARRTHANGGLPRPEVAALGAPSRGWNDGGAGAGYVYCMKVPAISAALFLIPCLGHPSFTPRARAAWSAALVLELMSEASCSATAASMWIVNRFAVGQSSATKSTPDSISPDTK